MRFGDGQICGAIALLAILNIFGLFCLLHRPAPVAAGILYGDDGPGRNFVEIAGDTRARGIYFVPEGTTILDLLEKAEASVPEAGNDKSLLKSLESGAKIVVDEGSRKVRIEKASNSRRYALHKPMDLNAADERDLTLVPGIGEKTARAIVEARRDSGGFAAVADLLEVPGIGLKKFEKFREYFFIGNKS
jgi:competence protein ComEA